MGLSPFHNWVWGDASLSVLFAPYSRFAFFTYVGSPLGAYLWCRPTVRCFSLVGFASFLCYLFYYMRVLSDLKGQRNFLTFLSALWAKDHKPDSFSPIQKKESHSRTVGFVAQQAENYDPSQIVFPNGFFPVKNRLPILERRRLLFCLKS